MKRFFVLNYIRGDSCLLISQTRSCASGVFRKSLCLIRYVIVCLFVVAAPAIAAAAGGGRGGGVGGGVFSCHLASDKPPPPHLITVSVCLKVLP